MTITQLFARRLKNLREDADLSQTQLADALGVSRGSISFYENGDRTPDIAFLAQVRDHFHVSLDYLLGYNDQIGNSARPAKTAPLPEYAAARIDSTTRELAACAEKYIPAPGEDPYIYFDCLHRDVQSIVAAYDRLADDLQSADTLGALHRFRDNLYRNSELDMFLALSKHAYCTPDTPGTPISEAELQAMLAGRKKGWLRKK